MSETGEFEQGRNGAAPAAQEEDSVAATNGDAVPRPEDAATAEAEALRSALEEAQCERREMFEQLQRAQADFENIRKRLQREKEEVVRYAAQSTIQSLLPIIDDFERALATEGIEPEFRKGLELIHRRIFEVFTRAGLKAVAQHESFDPNLHYAVDSAPADEGQSDQQILEVYQKGYLFKDRLMRASMVKVAVQD